MLAPISCPVCHSRYLRSVLRDASFSATLGGELSPLLGVRSYKCELGHVFMIVDAETIGTRSGAENVLYIPNQPR
jgi:hypothetical protein